MTPNASPVQELNPLRTTWHITFGTHGARLHGDGRPTVDREHNRLGEAFIYDDGPRADAERGRLRGAVVVLPREVRVFIESVVPSLCERGGWTHRVCAAPDEEDHIHTLLDAPMKVHGKDIRKWLKRWLTEALSARFGKPVSGEWWAECGSTKAVKERAYLNNAYGYIERQRTTGRGAATD